MTSLASLRRPWSAGLCLPLLAVVAMHGQAADIEPNRKATVDPLLQPADTSRPFIDGSSLVLKPRSYYLNRDRDTNPDTAGWALGGQLAWQSGWWKDSARLSASLYTSQKLYAPADKDGTQLFQPGPEAITVLGEANLTWRFTGNTGLRVGRQRLDLPYLGSHDIRMLPNTFEAAVVGNQSDSQLAWLSGYVDRIKRKNDDEFITMSEAAGDADANTGTVFAGARYKSDDLLAGAVFQRTRNVLDTLFVKTEGVLAESDDVRIKGYLQYTDQGENGNSAETFDSDLVATKLELSHGNTTWKLAGSRTNGDTGIKKPFGNPANYLSVIVEDFDRAEEDAWLAGISHDFGRRGPGTLSTFANIVSGDTPETGPNASADQREYDLTVDYRFREGPAERLWLRVRGAWVDQDDRFAGANDFFDFRIILNYDYDLLRGSSS
mgnify:CR=1 FL=1